MKPNFTNMSSSELRAYILAHRDDEIALQTYLDKRHSEAPNSRRYQPEEDVTKAIDEYLKNP